MFAVTRWCGLSMAWKPPKNSPVLITHGHMILAAILLPSLIWIKPIVLIKRWSLCHMFVASNLRAGFMCHSTKIAPQLLICWHHRAKSPRPIRKRAIPLSLPNSMSGIVIGNAWPKILWKAIVCLLRARLRLARIMWWKTPALTAVGISNIWLISYLPNQMVHRLAMRIQITKVDR